jgi:uncharacterized damage-inducible protein DinB
LSGTDAVLLDSFSRNGRVNAALLSALTPPDLALSDGPEGNGVGELLAHMAGFRRGWLGRVSSSHAEHLAKVEDDAGLDELKAAFTAGDQAVLDAVQAAYSQDTKFERAYVSDPAHFLLHTLIHDSHHRGQIMTLLRQNGRNAEQMEALEEATWPIWRE